jgi:uncharacterized repeat protein (TIGR04076 family)
VKFVIKANCRLLFPCRKYAKKEILMGEEKQNKTGDFITDLAKSYEESIDDYRANVQKALQRVLLEITVTRVTGDCPYGHQEGEKYIVNDMNHDGMCGSLYQAIHPPITTLHYGGGLPWENDADFFKGICPEMRVQVEGKRFEQERSSFLKTIKDPRDMTGKGFPGLDEYRVYLEVIGVANKCEWGHREGQRFEVDPFNIGKVCGFLFWEIYHFINLLFSGGSLVWEADENIIHGCCPDVYNQVTFRLIRGKR